MNSQKESTQDDDDGPSVDSENVNERIMARRLRIQRRVDVSKREASGEDLSQKKTKELTSELSKSRKQIEMSQQVLIKLISDGGELVSNVEAACDSREALRRMEEDENRRLRTEKLEAEVKAAAEKFEDITRKWDISLSKDAPQDLSDMLEEQKNSCDAVVDEKNKLINDLQMDLKSKDDRYVKDLRKQSEDVDIMLERMEEQIRSLKKAYREELDNIENAFYTERKELLDSQKEKWKVLTDSRQTKEVEYLDMREGRVNDFETQLQNLRVQDAEEYNMVKIKLETDVQILEQNLQQMKATYQLNQEKLEYNFQVLKKRDEENTITKSQQKRKITRLQDLLNNLKQKLKKQEKSYNDENQTLADDLKRISEQYKELQKKFRHFQATDNKKFNDIWKMNEEQIKELVSDVLSEDQIIFEQQLGMSWASPNLDFLDNVGPLSPGKHSSRTALEAASEIIVGSNQTKDEDAALKRESVSDVKKVKIVENYQSKEENLKRESPSEEGTAVKKRVSIASEPMTIDSKSMEGFLMQDSTADTTKIASVQIKHMLELLCDESGFLVEEKLMKLLAPIEKNEQSLMKLDAIFNAIGVETEGDIYMLEQYLKKQQESNKVATTETLVSTATQDSMKNHTDFIHPNDVIKSLRKFVEDSSEPYRESRRQSMKFGLGPVRDANHDEDYWRQLASVLDEKKEALWNAIIDGFEKYNHVLTERATLIHDTDALRQQNAELRMLLRQYLSSKVNQELEIPPTRVLQMELARE